MEKVRELTNGGSKESKCERPIEGDTDLSWDHEGLEPHPKPGEPKPPRVPKTKTNDERDCTKFLFKEGKQRSVSSQPIK